MSWKQLSVITDQQHAPALSDLFSQLGAVSVTYLDALDEPIYEPELGETKIWEQTRVVALFEMSVHAEVVELLVGQQFPRFSLKDWRLDILQDQVWERTWMAHFKPMLFGDRLWVCPSGSEQESPETVCMTLDPGLAFGTGTHATTALCLEWLARYDLKDKTVLDYGCGSGILAIASVLLGANHVAAVDIDTQAITATKNNAAKNNIDSKIDCYLPDDCPAIQADIVVANILANPLIEMVQPILTLLNSGGHIVLSGILSEQAGHVMEAYSPFCQLQEPVYEGDWCRIVGIKL
ncbi:MAG: 50S ribosomal protein L11 methyltransferase [Methylococcales bacterium]|jgi:ribosomal protein L11 methyltransferase|nr:50S ribosomal protein L11 methyltransferase [Methylococcales bacterium]MBT3699052.1 50S ribosomal protein L11 methyltransferase [Methylococcales bacterium]MBT3815466.1 50S ribosomal protein L11 methyltransferase [Methylococcales bacterium]MBT4032359.1 50S ribosomal protein L11 methyltransferase [Methylococcales bacterium]MBT4348613.1 50S ribosomal protein L11 methyltransferase [Methylococcales bacterium]